MTDRKLGSHDSGQHVLNLTGDLKAPVKSIPPPEEFADVTPTDSPLAQRIEEARHAIDPDALLRAWHAMVEVLREQIRMSDRAMKDNARTRTILAAALALSAAILVGQGVIGWLQTNADERRAEALELDHRATMRAMRATVLAIATHEEAEAAGNPRAAHLARSAWLQAQLHVLEAERRVDSCIEVQREIDRVAERLGHGGTGSR